MSVDCLLDTNVLVYAAAGRGAEEAKRKRAIELIKNEAIGLSAQVLQEFYVTVVCKITVPLSAEEALKWIEQFEAFPCLAIDRALVKIAIEISQRFQISYWDGAIIAATETLGAGTLYTEDLNHGQLYGSIRVVNPFLSHTR
ncbi:MAG: PIN domain-containing protein [Pirellulales bacterium]